MSIHKLLLIIALLMPLSLINGQRNGSHKIIKTCPRTGKVVLTYNVNFVKLGMALPIEKFGFDVDNSAGFTNKGFLLQYGIIRYFDLDIDQYRFGIGFNAPVTMSVNYWENQKLIEGAVGDIKTYPYMFWGVGVGPLFTLHFFNGFLLDAFYNIKPTLSYYGGMKYKQENDLEYREFSNLAFNWVSNYGMNLRYKNAMISFDFMPGKMKYKINQREGKNELPGSPFKKEYNVGMVNCALGCYF